MEKEQKAFFFDLSANRAASAEALEGFALRGVKNSVVEKYSDQAHFIYELLQNADDANATSARFELQKDKLIFAHNGTRRFSVSDPATEEQDLNANKLGDINSITAVGSSNKINEATIGKFGVGFKAVFQYTATPHIYDPNVFFKIERFIVPIIIETDFVGRKSDETLFVFPFDHENRSAEEAYSDISEKLKTLDYPLLFLTKLKYLTFEISGVIGLYGKVVEETQVIDNIVVELIRLTQNDGELKDDLYDVMIWLLSREDGNGHTYSVGFFVDSEGHLIPKTHSAFCFFPTKEVTGLNFIIHAPFLLTDSREGIRAGVQYNVDMINLLSNLAAESLVIFTKISESKKVLLIDDNIFDIVPYSESGFSDIGSRNKVSFKQFYYAIKNAFGTNKIIPSSNGYVYKKDAYWANVPQIAELFSNKQLGMLCRNEAAQWVFTSFGRQDTLRKNNALTKYIDSITEFWLDENDILDGWSLNNGVVYDGITPEFIELQPIEWLHEFYKWIAETKNRTDAIKTKPIFLRQDGKAVAAFDSMMQPILFLPTESDNGYSTIKKDFLDNEETFAFIKQLGIKEPSLRDEIYNIILPQFKNGVSFNTKSYFKKIFRYYHECSQTDAKDFLNIMREYSFILYKLTDDEKQYLGKPGELYFPNSSLKRWFQNKLNTKFVCFDEYLQLIGEDKKDELVNFLKDLGVNDIPRICQRILTEDDAYAIKSRYEWSQPSSHNMKSRKWTEQYIDGCQENIEQIIQDQDVALSMNLWNLILRFAELGFFNDSHYRSWYIIQFGSYEYFYRTKHSERFESSESIRLRTLPWLVNIDGGFVSTKELTLQNLHPQYNISSDEAVNFLKFLEIKEEVAKKSDDIDVSTFAESLGFSEEEAKIILKKAYDQRKLASSPEYDQDEDEFIDESGDDVQIVSSSVSRVVKEISQRTISAQKESVLNCNITTEDTSVDEDEYSKPTVDISNIIEKVKGEAEREIKEIVRLEDLKQQVNEAYKYSYGWFKALLELESINNGENNAYSREVSITFSKVELEEGTSRTLILKHPNQYIPLSMEDLADIPLELYFENQPMVKVAIEIINVKSYTLRAKLRTNAQIEGVDLSLVKEARIKAKNPAFLLEELKKAFVKLEFSDDYDLRNNLCENIDFVFGPPGTGKTTYLAKEIIMPIMKKNEDYKVLVLTPTNKAADVIVRRLMEIMDEDHSYSEWLVRFGATNDSFIEQSGVFRDKTFDIRKLLKNVTVTTIARFPYDYFLPDNNTRLHLNALYWDYIIFDEASMIPIANIIFPLYLKTPKRFIIAGDPFQIEPITTVDTWKSENIYTMVELKSFIEPKTVPHEYNIKLLNTQYRSVPEIGEVFSKFAYGGVLKHFRTSDSQRLIPSIDFFDIQALNIIKFPVSKYESIYRAKRLQSKSNYQVYSALFAFEFINFLSSVVKMMANEKLFRIGLIAPYRAQSDLIDKLMTTITLPKNIDVQVGTIHGFQGDECEIIIALFNPPPHISASKDMFLNKLNIINVSISRARDYLFVIMPDDNTENVGDLTLIKKVEELFKEQEHYVDELSPVIEEFIFGSMSYLEDNSFSTSHQLVNVYGKPEKRYEIRSEDNAVDIQVHE